MHSSRRKRDPEHGNLGLFSCSFFELTAEILPILLLGILLDVPVLELVLVLVLSPEELAKQAAK